VVVISPQEERSPASVLSLAGLSQGFLPRLPLSATSRLPGRTRVGPARGQSGALTAFCSTVLAPIPRRDQRRWGELYVRGLLTTPGRKTITRMADALSSAPADQSLQQFVNQSPWDWEPVRRAIAGHVDATIGTEAWVVQPALFLKSGDKSVAVARQFVPELAKVANCQVGVQVSLAATDAGTCPVDWQLVLPAKWDSDKRRRALAGVPPEMTGGEPWECAVGLVVSMSQRLGVPQRPVVLDLVHGNAAQAIQRLREANVPFIARIAGSTPVAARTRATGPGAMLVPAARVLAGPEHRRDAVTWQQDGRRRVSMMATMAIQAVPAPPVHRSPLARVQRRVVGPNQRTIERPLTLLGELRGNSTVVADYWVTDLGHRPLAEVVRLLKLRQRATADSEQLARIGLADFEGRSFRGWHHHVTLVSAARAFQLSDQFALEEESRAC
jgi:SRSO17 transposase